MILAVSLSAPPEPPKFSEAAEKELQKLQGKWKLQKEVSADGEKEFEMVLEFKGRKVFFEKQAKFEFEVSALDSTTDPKCLDLTNLVERGPVPKGLVLEAIYKLDGDTLTMAGHAGEEKKRPANFDPPKDKGTGMWVLKRVKE